MEHIHVNLDQPVFAPQFDLTLLQVVSMQDKQWIDGVTCVTQECDGELLYWNCSIVDAKKARKNANIATGLMPLIGIGQQVHSSDFEFNGIDYVASDWLSAVVTKDQFLHAKNSETE
ncbi:hypothetical protein [Moritella viscosa]|uniref:Uncharacterized protein n=1 Tax=Moritella viscosa TaxID=80854 RepID=A0A1L0AW05_9GAMM|nr:hypothetical protein [Moritella viscosa]SGZ20291.1 Putative uncharacterized protein VVP45 [Moritella viscosa]